ncbi:hypothetical protein [Pseudomonas batumici]|uniref:hypothetical protein n=1 Tax=Pseudomonas batumici TaxID=226910 RepID=UPI003CC918EE
MSVKFVLFDAFGTLVRIPNASPPYRQILKEGIRQGRRPRPDDLHHIMASPLSLSDAAEHFGIKMDRDHPPRQHLRTPFPSSHEVSQRRAVSDHPEQDQVPRQPMACLFHEVDFCHIIATWREICWTSFPTPFPLETKAGRFNSDPSRLRLTIVVC